ncbi:hypothetical protein CYY_004237 [Polysphondylium violaceum]|uniref:tRNA:m(4)X modification enzyme TRM13 n=1 Tax=Polysphondylium violaceum TaxID=133409 RepID=A0A8J4PVK7_9MYCE|nr:hypothetical protein CYY_004237 [Polysphondylium violaceum]
MSDTNTTSITATAVNINDKALQRRLKKEEKKKNKPLVDHSLPLKQNPTQQDIDNHADCLFWIINKKKHRAEFCKYKRTNNSTFCTHHRPIEECNDTKNIENNDSGEKEEGNKNTNKKRVVCPLNPLHIVYESKLAKHIKGCPNAIANQKQAHIEVSKTKEYYKENINNLLVNDKSTKLEPITLSKVPTEQLQDLSMKLDSIFQQLYPDGVPTSNTIHSSFNKIFNSDHTLKHIQQESSMISLLENHQLLNKENVYLEFGAGSGKLSYHIFSSLEKQSGGHILIDRMKFRSLKKVDRMIKYEPLCKYFDRLLIDIRHLDMSKLDVLTLNNFVITSKHLCGCATDFTLDSISNLLKNNPSIVDKFKGIGIATCCHHICSWDTYINQEFIKDQLKLTPKEFQLICAMSSWATIGSQEECLSTTTTEDKKRKRQEYQSNNNNEIESSSDEDDDEDQEKENKARKEKEFKDAQDEFNRETIFSKQRKEELGYKCKRIIDYGRHLFIEQQLNLNSNLFIYTNLSKENLYMVSNNKK